MLAKFITERDCPEGDLNPHARKCLRPSNVCVYQFHHPGFISLYYKIYTKSSYKFILCIYYFFAGILYILIIFNFDKFYFYLHFVYFRIKYLYTLSDVILFIVEGEINELQRCFVRNWHT